MNHDPNKPTLRGYLHPTLYRAMHVLCAMWYVIIGIGDDFLTFFFLLSFLLFSFSPFYITLHTCPLPPV